MSTRRPGRAFWLGVALADLRTPGTGRHRVKARLEELYETNRDLETANFELTNQCRFLRGELARATGMNNMLVEQDEMNAALSMEPVKEPYLLFGSNAESTLPMHMLGEALAKASVGTATASENPAAIPAH